MNLQHHRYPLFAAVICCAAAATDPVRAGKPVVQYGFDYTSGSVQSRGGAVIVNDSIGGARFPAFATRPNGGTYSADIPLRTRFATGIGSLDLSTGSCSNNYDGAGEGTGPCSLAELLAWHGVTIEFWMKGGPADGIVLTLSGTMVFKAKPEGVRFSNGFNDNGVTASLDRTGWHHVAGIIARPRFDGLTLTADLVLYVDGMLQGSVQDSPWKTYFTRGVAIGNHPILGYDEPWTGKIYEPRLSEGVLTPEEFMCYPPHPATSAATVPVVESAITSQIPEMTRGHANSAVIVAWITSAAAAVCALTAILALRARRTAVRKLREMTAQLVSEG